MSPRLGHLKSTSAVDQLPSFPRCVCCFLYCLSATSRPPIPSNKCIDKFFISRNRCFIYILICLCYAAKQSGLPWASTLCWRFHLSPDASFRTQHGNKSHALLYGWRSANVLRMFSPQNWMLTLAVWVYVILTIDKVLFVWVWSSAIARATCCKHYTIVYMSALYHIWQQAPMQLKTKIGLLITIRIQWKHPPQY